MTLRALGGVLAIYLLVLAVVCAAVTAHFRLAPPARAEVVLSVWNGGKLVAREVVAREVTVDGATSSLSLSLSLSPSLERARLDGGTLVAETVVGEGPVWKDAPLVLAVSFVPGLDGLRVRLGGRLAYVTPDDLLSSQAYDRGSSIPALSLTIGVDLGTVVSLVAERLGVAAEAILEGAVIERVRMERSPHTAPRPTAEALSREDVAQSIRAVGSYLAYATQDDGRFLYIVDATTGESAPGYSLPRHAGTTYFLAQAAAFTGDATIRAAALRAAEYMRREGLVSCGAGKCFGTEAVVDLGSSALAALAFAEIIRAGLDDSYKVELAAVARFLREQQRADGEFMHHYMRYARRPIDRQGLYYSSEAVLALSRTYRVLRDPADLEAASRGLSYLVGPAWSFFGDRYYFGEEHWTCQAMADLWPSAPNSKALDFCLRWAGFNQHLQQSAGDAPSDSDGALGISPLITPRLTPIASRCEAGVATLEVAKLAGLAAHEVARLEAQLRRAIAYLLRHQFVPGSAHLFAHPEAVRGAFPGSRVDWKLRIDYQQHAGSALVRWLEVTAPADAAR